jgi:hypothetical protein
MVSNDQIIHTFKDFDSRLYKLGNRLLCFTNELMILIVVFDIFNIQLRASSADSESSRFNISLNN